MPKPGTDDPRQWCYCPYDCQAWSCAAQHYLYSSRRLCSPLYNNLLATGLHHIGGSTKTGQCKVELPNVPVFSDLSMSLPSVPALAKKNIATLFMPGKALLIDLEDSMNILRRVLQDADSLFYINNRQVGPLEALKRTARENTNTVMAMVRTHEAVTKYEAEIASPALQIIKVSGRFDMNWLVVWSAMTAAKNKSNVPTGKWRNTVAFQRKNAFGRCTSVVPFRSDRSRVTLPNVCCHE